MSAIPEGHRIQADRTEPTHSTLPVGRALRMCAGLLLLAAAGQLLAGATLTAGIVARTAGWLVGLLALYLALGVTVRRWIPNLNPWLGAILALLPAVAIWATGGVRTLAVILFIGLSLVVAAVRGDGGCEVTALPAALTGRHTHLPCLLFSPIDWLEARLRRRG